MTDRQYEYRLDSHGEGYFGLPRFEAGAESPNNPVDEPWSYLALAYDRAKRGDFGLVPGALDIYGRTGSVSVDHACIGLITSAGPARCFPRVIELVHAGRTFDEVYGPAGSLAARGELSYVPILVDTHDAIKTSRDAVFILDYIRGLVGDVGPNADAEPDEFVEAAWLRYEQLVSRFGTDKVLLFEGEPYSVVRLAHRALDEVRTPHTFSIAWRSDFEAATGIDCRSWYRDRIVRPLAVAATLEEFLASQSAAQYETGVRYFFGHRIPD